MIVTLVQAAAYMATLLWIAASWVVYAGKRYNLPELAVEVAGLVWSDLRPLYLPAVAAYHACRLVNGISPAWVAFMLIVDLVIWWALKDLGDHDDRWKRRREKLAARVAQFGGRLTVVPAAGGA